MRLGIKLRQRDPAPELLISTLTRDFLLGGPGKKGFWLEIGSGDHMSDADRELGQGGCGWIKAASNCWTQKGFRKECFRIRTGSYTEPWTQHSSSGDDLFINKGRLDQKMSVTIGFGATTPHDVWGLWLALDKDLQRGMNGHIHVYHYSVSVARTLRLPPLKLCHTVYFVIWIHSA